MISKKNKIYYFSFNIYKFKTVRAIKRNYKILVKNLGMQIDRVFNLIYFLILDYWTDKETPTYLIL